MSLLDSFTDTQLVPLLELFAVCDDVFTEDDWFDACDSCRGKGSKQGIGLGRIRRQWGKVREVLRDE